MLPFSPPPTPSPPPSLPSPLLSSSPQLKVKSLGLGQGGEGAGAQSNGPVDEATVRTIDELKRAFELVEVSSPGVSDQLISRILVHLQSR